MHSSPPDTSGYSFSHHKKVKFQHTAKRKLHTTAWSRLARVPFASSLIPQLRVALLFFPYIKHYMPVSRS
ncbi:unnamed protein product [Periconia digitata]|uniref:Uncharacterized protein n=1 Tax=Periconia digitata TaxID=1303443 RepID=A0A9W4UD17_9PLEO|nr:unnamed protein product [Periconia digitata]